MRSFKQYFNESEESEQLNQLIMQIDQAIDQAEKIDDDHNQLSPEEADFLTQKIGGLVDVIMRRGERLPDELQGSAGEKPAHINTVRRLRELVNNSAELPEALVEQIKLLETTLPHDDPKKNPFLKPKWAKKRDAKDDGKEPIIRPHRQPGEMTKTSPARASSPGKPTWMKGRSVNHKSKPVT